MNQLRLTVNGFALVVCAITFTLTATAQTNRKFVSTSGNNANPCTRELPCRDFSFAIAAVAPNGEVVVLDSGGYGAVTITKSVAIIAPPGIHAAIAPSSGTAITINTLGVTVVLRGLYLNSQGAANGIRFTSGQALHVESCVISGFTSAGIDVQLDEGGAGHVFIKDTIIRNMVPAPRTPATGAEFEALTGTVHVSVDHCRFEGIGGTGLDARVNSRVTVRDSVAANNNGPGFIATAGSTPGTTAELLIENCLVMGCSNGIATVSALGQPDQVGSAVVRVAHTVITNNHLTGVIGNVISFGNNRLVGNPANGSFASSILLE